MKRILGNERMIQQTRDLETKVYLSRTQRARQLRRYKTDLLEVYGGNAGITQRALHRGLRAHQPVDAIYGLRLDGRADHARLRNLILVNKPFLVVYEIACTAWSNIQYLNCSPAQLQALRLEQDEAIKEMVKTIVAAEEEYGAHFLIENPAYADFWRHPAMLKLAARSNVAFRVGHMCAFNLRDKDGLLMKKPTGWMSDLTDILDRVGLPCSCQTPHGQVLGGNSKRAQVYSPELCKAIVHGLESSLRDAGDERYNAATEEEDAWLAEALTAEETQVETWQPPGEERLHSVFFLDITRHEDSWLPILKEAESQLEGKVRSDRVMPPNTPFFEQVKALVPWRLVRVQICRTPMQRRLPVDLIQEGVKHRGVALWYNDGSVELEAEAISTILSAAAGRFSRPVRAAVFFYGVAPDSSLNPEDNKQPQVSKKQAESNVEVEEQDKLSKWSTSMAATSDPSDTY